MKSVFVVDAVSLLLSVFFQQSIWHGNWLIVNRQATIVTFSTSKNRSIWIVFGCNRVIDFNRDKDD